MDSTTARNAGGIKANGIKAPPFGNMVNVQVTNEPKKKEVLSWHKV
jgi:hypothetical protein